MSQFKCAHCDLPFRTLCGTVDHNIITHPTEELRVKRYRRRGSYNGCRPQISLECSPNLKGYGQNLKLYVFL